MTLVGGWVGVPAALAQQKPEKLEAATPAYNAAVNLQNNGLFEDAAKEWTKFINTYGTDARVDRAFHYLGVCYLQRNQLDTARQCFETVINTYPQFDLLEATYLHLGETQFRTAQSGKAGMYEAAAATLGTLLDKYPQGKYRPQALFRRGDCLYYQGKKKEAAQLYADVAAKFSNDQVAPDALYALGVTQEELKDPAEAGKAYDEFIKQFSGHRLAGEVIMRRAETLFAGGQYEGAADWFGSAAARPKFDLADLATVRRADALAQLKKYAEAADLYASVEKKYPQSTHIARARTACHALARTLLTEKKPAEALAVVEKILPGAQQSPQAPQLLMDQADAIYDIPARRREAVALYAALASAHAKDPQAPQALYMAGFAALETKDYAAAARHAEAFLAAYKGNDLTPDVVHVAAESNIQLGKFAEAEKQFDDLLKRYSSHASAATWKERRGVAMMALARAYQQQKAPEKAREVIGRLIADLPGSPLLAEAHYRMGEYSAAAKDAKAAATEYQQVIAQWPASEFAPHAAFALGSVRLEQNDHAGAEAAFDVLITKYADHKLVPRARYARGIARQQLGKFAPAIADMEAVLAAGPSATEKSDARYVLGLCQVGLKKPAEAVATFQALLQDDPRYAAADKVVYELAWTLRSDNKEKEAAETFARLAKEYSGSPLVAESLFHVGESAYKAGDFKAAATAYQAAMEKAGKTELGEKAAHKLGWTCFRVDDVTAAQKAFAAQRAGWPSGPLSGDAAFMEAECLMKQKKYKEAMAAYEQVQGTTSKDFKTLALLHAGQAAGQLKQWEKSLELLSRCVKESADSSYLPEALYEQAWAQQNLGKLPEALTLYEQVVAKGNPAREVAARAQFMIGEIQFDQKKHKEAIASFFKVAYGYGFPQWQADAKYEAARCFEVLEMKPQARKQYQELVDKFPQSDKVPLAKERIKALQD